MVLVVCCVVMVWPYNGVGGGCVVMVWPYNGVGGVLCCDGVAI